MTVHVRNLTRRFGARTVLGPVTVDIAPGEFVALIGRSGSGKSTLLRALAGLDAEVEGDGSVSVPERLSVAFQDARLLPWRSVLANVLLGLDGPDADARGRAVLAEVGLAGREASWPNELSGGEQQRVALARSLVRAPQLLLADEPFGALDALTRLRMHALLRRLHAVHRPSVLLVTHDVDEALTLATRVLLLEAGRLVEDRRIALPEDPAAAAAERARLKTEMLAAIGVPLDEGLAA